MSAPRLLVRERTDGPRVSKADLKEHVVVEADKAEASVSREVGKTYLLPLATAV